MQRHHSSSISGGFEVLKEAGIADFRWLFDMKNIYT